MTPSGIEPAWSAVRQLTELPRVPILVLQKGQIVEAWEPSKGSTFSKIGEHWIEKYFHIVHKDKFSNVKSGGAYIQ